MTAAAEIYRVQADVTNFQTLVLEDERLWGSDLLTFGCEPIVDWVPPEVFVLDPSKRRGHFFHFDVGVIAFERAALADVEDLLEMAGQILPLSSRDGEFFILNVVECINALDPRHTRWKTSPGGRRVGIADYAFRRALPESSLFKIPETRFAEVLTYTGIKAPEDEFRSRYEERELQGLHFTPLGTVPRE